MRLAESPSDPPADPQTRADDVLTLLEQQAATFRAMPDEPGQQIHSLFAGLYRETTTRWLAALSEEENNLFGLLLVRRFYEIYQTSVPDYLNQSVKRDMPVPPVPWRKYHWLGKRLTMRSPISLHLVLISLGARAHIYHDLGDAIRLALEDHEQITGTPIEPNTAYQTVAGATSEKAFQSAALDYVDWHRARQSGWRHWVLGFYAVVLRALKPIWVGELERWRRHARDEALSGIGIK